MGCGCNKMTGGRKSKRVQWKKSKKQYRKKSYKRKSMKKYKMMKGGSGLIDNATSGMHQVTSKLLSSPYTPSDANIQPAAIPYRDSYNPYFV
jgi:hypothetical protein